MWDHTSCQGKTLTLSAEMATGQTLSTARSFCLKKMLLGFGCLYHSRYKLWHLICSTGQVCAVITGLLAIMLSLSVRNKSPHKGCLTTMTFYKFMLSYQQNLESCLVVIINMHLWQFVYQNLNTFIASAVSKKWRHMISFQIKLFNSSVHLCWKKKWYNILKSIKTNLILFCVFHEN